MTSDEANRPRWRGQPGFFEIWFLVVFDPAAARAFWLRYTTFAPARGAAARATLWAAAFDARAESPSVAGKTIVPATAYDAGPRDRTAIRIGVATLSNGSAEGAVITDAHRIAWDLRFAPAAQAAHRAPPIFDRLPLPTRVAHANGEVPCDGWIEVDGVRHALRGAPMVQKHLWGTRRVEELSWLYCPHFAEDPAARFEATSVRLRRRVAGILPAPATTPIWLRSGAGEQHWWNPLARTRAVSPAVGRLTMATTTPTRAVTATACADPRSLVGYVYRDPSGFDLYVAQSDVASCVVETRTRRHPLASWQPGARLTSEHAAAVEFHGPTPLPGVRYIPWDGTTS